MTTTLNRVKCGNCRQYHSSAAEVKACYYPPLEKLCMKLEPHGRHTDVSRNLTCPGFTAPATVASKGLTVVWQGVEYVSAGCTQPQLDYIGRLGGDPLLAVKYTTRGASLYIDRLKREGRKVTDHAASAPNRQTTKIPLEMLHDLPDGYYASRPDSAHPYTFFKVSRPKSGNFKGSLKIMTQHGPDYKLALVIYPGDRVYWSNIAVEDDLLLVVVDKNGCAIAYAEEIGRCMRCNTELTDERSRWFGIGPECEKHWPHIIDLITDRKGPFIHGWEA